ncbi:MAG: hypothetical protein H0W87_08500 [Actinobacteria bacterium]|nr:hypothetical protein [Actinomycetota bacterium]
MGKYGTDLPSKSPDRSVERVESYLRKQGFWKTGRPGKEVWKRNARTRLLSPEYISITPGDGHVHLEAWIRAITPFVGLWVGKVNPLKGAPFSFASKDRLRKRLDQIERLVG